MYNWILSLITLTHLNSFCIAFGHHGNIIQYRIIQYIHIHTITNGMDIASTMYCLLFLHMTWRRTHREHAILVVAEGSLENKSENEDFFFSLYIFHLNITATDGSDTFAFAIIKILSDFFCGAFDAIGAETKSSWDAYLFWNMVWIV